VVVIFLVCMSALLGWSLPFETNKRQKMGTQKRGCWQKD
jgi:hypothetical protein